MSVAKPGFRFALFSILFAAVVIMLGAFTRLVDAGLGCPDWPVCYGHILWPETAEEVAAANAKFPGTPVEHDKTWPEQVHRLFASALGVFCIALVAIAFRQRRQDSDYPFKLPILLLIMVIVQGLFGMWTVTLKLWPQVVTAHLLGGFATLSLLTLLAFRLSNRYWSNLDLDQVMCLAAIKKLTVLVLVAVIIQIALGGWTTSNYAALACPDFPLCQSKVWPVMDFAAGFDVTQAVGPNYLGGIMDSAARTSIHFTHRVGALVVTVAVVFLVVRLWQTGYSPAQNWAKWLALVLFAQLALGVSNVVFALPLGVAVAHNAIGALLLISVVSLCHRVFTACKRP